MSDTWVIILAAGALGLLYLLAKIFILTKDPQKKDRESYYEKLDKTSQLKVTQITGDSFRFEDKPKFNAGTFILFSYIPIGIAALLFLTNYDIIYILLALPIAFIAFIYVGFKALATHTVDITKPLLELKKQFWFYTFSKKFTCQQIEYIEPFMQDHYTNFVYQYSIFVLRVYKKNSGYTEYTMHIGKEKGLQIIEALKNFVPVKELAA